MNNDNLLRRSLSAVWHPCTQMKQHTVGGDGALPMIPIARGQGAWLYDFDGRRYLDGISSWWVNLFGHAHPRINAALREQLDELEHVILAGFTHRPVVELSERLAALSHGHLGHCFFASDGASATEIALKMSFHSWRNRGREEKRNFLCLEGGYHGETVGALAVTDVAIFRDAYAPLVTPGSYCVVFDTFVEDMPPKFFADRPWDVGNNPKTAVHQWLGGHPEFEIDVDMEQRLQVTVAPHGFLRRRPE